MGHCTLLCGAQSPEDRQLRHIPFFGTASRSHLLSDKTQISQGQHVGQYQSFGLLLEITVQGSRSGSCEWINRPGGHIRSQSGLFTGRIAGNTDDLRVYIAYSALSGKSECRSNPYIDMRADIMRIDAIIIVKSENVAYDCWRIVDAG